MAEDFLCVRCAQAQKTCCQTCEIYVSPGDARRIAAFTGQTDFYEDRRPVSSTYGDQDDDPPWRDNVFQPDGSRRVLKRQASGDCTFLGAAGCTLPLETRPLVCRLYPFDYDAQGLKDDLSEGCPVQLVRPGWTLLTELDMKQADAQRWRDMLYREIELEGEFRATDRPLAAPHASPHSPKVDAASS